MRLRLLQHIRMATKNPWKSAGQSLIHSWEMFFYIEEDTLEELPLDEVVEGVNRELDLMKSFPVFQAVPRAEVTGKAWSI